MEKKYLYLPNGEIVELETGVVCDSIKTNKIKKYIPKGHSPSPAGSTPSVKALGNNDLRLLRVLRGELNIEQYKFVKDISNGPEKGLPMTEKELRTPLENLERMCRKFGHKTWFMEFVESKLHKVNK